MEGTIGSKDPTFMSLRTIFLSNDFIQFWKDHVETICPPNKTSTDYFADTRVMGILCQHDIPLFLVNIQAAGKKQHYLFALVVKFFKHVPYSQQIGILYDIGCQGDHTLKK